MSDATSAERHTGPRRTGEAARPTRPGQATGPWPATVPAEAERSTHIADHSLRLRHNPALLDRPGGRLQVGWDPERAVVVTPPDGVPHEEVRSLLRLLDGTVNRSGILDRARDKRLDAEFVDHLLDELERRGVLERRPPVEPQPPFTPTWPGSLPAGGGTPQNTRRIAVTLMGRGPLSDMLAQSLPAIGVRVRRRAGSVGAGNEDFRRGTPGHLVVLSDTAVVEPQLAVLLTRATLPHLVVTVREGLGLVGPLVLPGLSSCLNCTHLYRCDRDPDWPLLAAQLAGRTGSASHATVMATAAVAQAQIETIIAALNAEHPESQPPPAVLSRTIEVDAENGRTSVRTWPRHPRCVCLSVEAPT